MPTFMILRNVAQVRTASLFDSFRPTIAATAPFPELRVEAHDIATHEVADLARDPQIEAVAIPMPTTLIRPLAVGASAVANDAWGIAAIKADTSSFSGDGV